MRSALAILLAGAYVLPGCARAGRRGDARPPLRLNFIAVYEFSKPGEPPPRVGANAVMELSGLSYDPDAGELVAVADDGQPARLYRFGVELGAGTLRVTGRREVPVRAADGGPLNPALDAEGVAVARGKRGGGGGGGGGYYLAVEGRDKALADGTPFRPRCALLEVGNDGRVAHAVELPPRYRPPARRDNAGPRGPRDNGSLESVALSPGGAELFTAMQLPLIEDAAPPGESPGGGGGVVRLLRFRRAGRTFVPDGEFAYVLDPQPPPRAATAAAAAAGEGPAPAKDKNNGLVELVALTDRRLLALEKGAVLGGPSGGVSVRVYEIDLAGARDVSAVRSFAGLGPAGGARYAVRKRLVLNLADVRPGLGTPAMPNFEGMALGPEFAGRPTLILVSDDNGNDRRDVQRTVFVAFTVEGPAG